MIVVVANNIPPAVRGRMKLWFVEPKPNVFVSGINDSNARKVVDYLMEHCPAESGVLIFRKISKPPGFEIRGSGDPKRAIVNISGLQLIKNLEIQNFQKD